MLSFKGNYQTRRWYVPPRKHRQVSELRLHFLQPWWMVLAKKRNSSCKLYLKYKKEAVTAYFGSSVSLKSMLSSRMTSHILNSFKERLAWVHYWTFVRSHMLCMWPQIESTFTVFIVVLNIQFWNSRFRLQHSEIPFFSIRFFTLIHFGLLY